MLQTKKILCPTDFSTGSNAAIAQAALLALRTQASIDLVHVIPFEPAQPMNPHFIYKVPEFERSLRAEAQRQLDELARSLAAKGVPARTFIGNGDAAREIVRVADEQQAELIVIATYGQTGWRRLAFGSVAEKVVRLANCPVLTIRGQAASAGQAA